MWASTRMPLRESQLPGMRSYTSDEATSRAREDAAPAQGTEY
jgi:hypothetical protein